MLTALLAAVAAFSLEWNATYDTSVPYEVELNPAKIGAEGFAVFADGRRLASVTMPGKAPNTIRLRFHVPDGTRSLTCRSASAVPFADAAKIDNLFAGAFDVANRSRWVLPEGVAAQMIDGGLRFLYDGRAGRSAHVTYAVNVPDGLAGKPVRQEIDLTSRTHLVWGGKSYIEQLDAKGSVLPETLCDVRWTSHMRPNGKLCAYRDEGHIHPKARKLRFTLELRDCRYEYDEYGHKISDRALSLPRIDLTGLAVRVGADLPFPKWADGCFGTGVSGKPGDTSLRMGGASGRSVFFPTHTRAAWTQSHQFREEKDICYPVGAGTVEAWIKPDWKTFAERRDAFAKAQRLRKSEPCVIFDAYQGYIACECKRGMGKMFFVAYEPTAHRLSLLMRDYKANLFEKSFDVEIPDRVWSHLAVAWKPGDMATVYLSGRKVGEMPLNGFEIMDIADKSVRNPNDRAVPMEFNFGASFEWARAAGDNAVAPPGGVFFEGEGDCLRISSGCRYTTDFSPARSFALDADTRALFTFDRTFDGVTGGGFGFLPCSVRSLSDRIDHELKLADGRTIQYYPKALPPSVDPYRTLDHDNYPVLPTDAEYREARVAKTLTRTMKSGEKVSFDAAERAYPDYVEYANLSETETLDYPIAVRDGRPDPRSFGDLSDTLCAAAENDRERAEDVFQFAMRASDYFMNHQASFAAGSDIPQSACYEAMVMLNSYCGFECGPLNNMTANMLATVAGCPAGQTAGYGHEFQQAFYDGKNHIYDLSARLYFPAEDNETASYLKEAGDQPGIFFRVGKSGDHFIRRSTRGNWVRNPSYQEKFGAVLNPGERMRVYYANNAQMNNLQTRARKGAYSWPKLLPGTLDYAKVAGADDSTEWLVRKDRVFPHYSSAFITFDGKPNAKNPAFAKSGDGFVYKVYSPYPVVFGEYAAFLSNGHAVELELSTDGGKTFRRIPADKKGIARLEYMVKARYRYLVKVRALLEQVVRFVAKTEGEVNPRVYPGWVKGGKNVFTFKSESQTSARVTFGWREPSKEIVIDGTVHQGAIPGFERELAAMEPVNGLSLKVSGVSPMATARTCGRIDAALSDGLLRLSYAPQKRPAIKHGTDNPEKPEEFPAFAAVDIVDGDAVKTLTVIVAPNVRLLLPENPDAMKHVFTFDEIPAGPYQVWTLARTESRGDTGTYRFRDLNDPKVEWRAWQSTNESYDYRGMVFFGREGELGRWKWSTVDRRDIQHSASGHMIKTLDFPATKTFTIYQPWKAGRTSLGAVLIVPGAGVEAELEMRNIFFGLNSDPFHVK